MGSKRSSSGSHSHSKVNKAKRLLQSFLFGLSVVGVGLFVELSHILHHLESQGEHQPTNIINSSDK